MKHQENNSLAEYLWFDSRTLSKNQERFAILQRITHLGYNGVLIDAGSLQEIGTKIPENLKIILKVRDDKELSRALKVKEVKQDNLIVASESINTLQQAAKDNYQTCYYGEITDSKTLMEAIDSAPDFDFCLVKFKDPTNIPLELIIASLQSKAVRLIKEIQDVDNYEDAIVSMGVMEVGVSGVMYSPFDNEKMDRFKQGLLAQSTENIPLEVGTVMLSEPVGMGHRGCLDLVTLFNEDEGMLVGSTSQGGILCCPEVFYLPYMEKRPFRVNAGGIHSYIFGPDNKTNYMSELKAGMKSLVIGIDGQARKTIVGRVKTEVRPLRLIEAKFRDNIHLNVILQDDWHVRIFSDKGLPLNITEVRPGDKILGHVASIGRHVGIDIAEKIMEQ